jgi:hypothetical protein
LQDAAMGFELCSCLEGQDKVLVPQADQLGKVPVLGNGRNMD